MAADGYRWNVRLSTLIVGIVLGVVWISISDRLAGLLQNTIMLVLGSWAIAMPIGVLLGIMIAKIDMPGRTSLRMLLLAALFVPLYVYAGAWQAALARGGWAATWLPDGFVANAPASGWVAAIWIHGTAGVAWIALLTAAALASIERPLEEQSLVDAGASRVLRRVSLRRAIGGIGAGAIWTALICATEITVTDLFQIRTFAEEAFVEASLGSLLETGRPTSGDLVAGWALIAAATWAGAVWIAPVLPAAAGASLDTTWTWRPRRGRWLWSVAALLLAGGLYLAPAASLFWKAGIEVVDGERLFSPAKALNLVVRSPWLLRREWTWTIASGGVAALLATSLALGAAWLARLRPVLRWPMFALAALAAATPGPLLGVATIAVLNQPPDSAFFWLTALYDRTLAGPVVVQTVRALPLATLLIWSQLATIPDGLIDAARSDGAGWWTQLWRIAAPLRWRALVTAFAASLLIAAGETPGTLLVAPPGATLLSVRIFGLLHYGADDQVAALCLSVIGLFAAGCFLAGAVQLVSRRRRQHRIES